MKRWRGWGNSETDYPLAETARAYLVQQVGEPLTLEDVSEEQILNEVPPSRLEPGQGLLCDSIVRAAHARGQSLPDWVAVHSGQIGEFPDAVAYPESEADLELLMELARTKNAVLIPYGGGTSVLGHINPTGGDHPVICVDLSHMDQLIELDEGSRMAVFQAGVAGPSLEDQLGARGYTLGHFPQSFEYSTLGGWIATRSVGQQCYRYGRIDEMFLGGRLLTPAGWWDMPALPASAAGPDLRQVALGSEGRLGIISQAAVRVHRKPPKEEFQAVFFPNWEAGAAAVREIVQAGVDVSMLRLSDPDETWTTLQLSGKDKLVRLARSGLKLVGIGDERCLLIYGLSGVEDDCQHARWQVLTFCKKYGGFAVDFFIGKMWRKTRFLTPYLRNTLWQQGFALDTLETCQPWSKVLQTVTAVKNELQTGLQPVGEKPLVFAHLSHLYDIGASTYITYLWRRSADPSQTLANWQALKKAASDKIVEMGGTISHQHGVGVDHRPYLEAEKGLVGMKLLADICRSVDPDGRMNPGKLVD